MVASFTSNAGGLWVLPLVFSGIAALFGYVFSLASYRPRGERWVLVPAMLMFVASLFLANIGGHSLWLTAFGETLHCKVVGVESHSSRRSPTSYSNKLECGDRKLDYHPTMYRTAHEPGSEMDIVVDRTGFVRNLEPDKVTAGRSLLLLLCVLMNAAFILFVARRPVRTAAPTSGEA